MTNPDRLASSSDEGALTDEVDRPDRRSFVLGTIVAVSTLGVLARGAQYLANRSLWHDEAFIALNLLDRGFAALFIPLDHHQVAPILWLILEKVVVGGFGESEMSLRLVSVVSGIFAVGLFWVWTRRVGSPAVGLLAMTLFSFSDRLIAHSAEVKPYSTDVFVTLLLLLTVPSRDDRNPSCRGLGLSFVAGLLGIVLSYPSVFVFVGVWCAHGMVAWSTSRRVSRSDRGFWACFALGGVLFVAAVAWLFKQPFFHPRDPALTEYWAKGFRPGEGWVAFLDWSFGGLLGVCDYAFEPFGFLVLPLALVGGWRWWNRNRKALLISVGIPIAGVFAAGFLELYPWRGSRLTLFLAPGILLAAGEGGWTLLRAARDRRLYRAASILLLCGLGFGLGKTLYHGLYPRTRHHLRPVLIEVAERLEVGDGFVVACPAEFEYYRRRDETRFQGIVRCSPEEARNRFEGRVWILGTGKERRLPQAERELLEELRRSGKPQARLESQGAWAELFEKP